MKEINYNLEKEKIDQYYQEVAKKVFPFISKNRITVISKGFYRKHNSGYYGLTMMYDKAQAVKKAILVGYYFIPENYIILPSKTVLTDKKIKFIESWLKQGYQLINTAPSIFLHEFDPISKEYEVAEYLYNKHRDDILNNKQKEGVSIS